MSISPTEPGWGSRLESAAHSLYGPHPTPSQITHLLLHSPPSSTLVSPNLSHSSTPSLLSPNLPHSTPSLLSPNLSHPTPSSSLLAFSQRLFDLKLTKRTGWIRHGVPHVESVAEHSYRMAVLSMALFPGNEAIVKMCLVHDLPEAICGDIVPGGKVSDGEKKKLEEEAFGVIVKEMSGLRTEEFVGLFEEYEERKSGDSKIVKDLDRLEMVLQANEYELAYPGIGLDLSDFFKGQRAKLGNAQIIECFDELERQRNARRSSIAADQQGEERKRVKTITE